MSFRQAVISAVFFSFTVGSQAADRTWQLTRNGVIAQKAGRTVRVPLPDWVYAGPRYGCVPSLAVGPKGEAVVSSDVMPTLWRVDPQTLAVTRHELTLDTDNDKDVGFSELAWVEKEGVYVGASTADRALWRIDAALKTARKIAGSRSSSSCRDAAAAAGAAQAHSRRPQPW